MLKMNKITASNSELHSPEDLENTKIVDNLAVLWITTVIRINGKIDSELHSPQNRLYFGIALTQISELNSPKNTIKSFVAKEECRLLKVI